MRTDGSTNPAALNIELDIAQYLGHEAGGDTRSYVRIWGLSLKDIRGAYKFANGHIKVEAGMADGYPLSKRKQAGTLIEGSIQQAFGNWLGTDMTLDIILGTPTTGTHIDQKNFTFLWKKGQKIGELIKNVLQDRFPDRAISVRVNQDRTAAQDSGGTYRDFTEFVQMIHRITSTPGKDDGIMFYDNGKEISVKEHPLSPKSDKGSGGITTIEFADLLGQVTWYSSNQISAKLVMRGDLDQGDLIRFPPGLISTVTANSMPAYGGTSRDQDSLSFSGQYEISQVQHFGNYRQQDAQSWNTMIWAYNQEGSAGANDMVTYDVPVKPGQPETVPTGGGLG